MGSEWPWMIPNNSALDISKKYPVDLVAIHKYFARAEAISGKMDSAIHNDNSFFTTASIWLRVSSKPFVKNSLRAVARVKFCFTAGS